MNIFNVNKHQASVILVLGSFLGFVLFQYKRYTFAPYFSGNELIINGLGIIIWLAAIFYSVGWIYRHKHKSAELKESLEPKEPSEPVEKE